MNSADPSTRHAQIAAQRVRRLQGDRSLDRATLVNEIQAKATQRAQRLTADQHTLFVHGVEIRWFSGTLRAQAHHPALVDRSGRTLIHESALLSPQRKKLALTAMQWARIKIFGRRAFVESTVDQIFRAMAMIEARAVADKLVPAPEGWARAAERREIAAEAAPAKASSTGALRV